MGGVLALALRRREAVPRRHVLRIGQYRVHAVRARDLFRGRRPDVHVVRAERGLVRRLDRM